MGFIKSRIGQDTGQDIEGIVLRLCAPPNYPTSTTPDHRSQEEEQEPSPLWTDSAAAATRRGMTKDRH